MDANIGVARGQPNYKRRLQDYLEAMLAKDATFEDHENNNDLHEAIIRGDFDQFKEIVNDKKFDPKLLNLRNCDGKSPLFLAIEHGRQDIFQVLFKEYKKEIDFTSKDTIHGNTALHMACLQENLEVAKKIFNYDPQLCMRPNSLGRSPFFLACQTACETKSLHLLEIFESMKTEAIVVQDYLGENMLFMCARSSAVEVFNWFQGTELETYNNFFRARGQQNYKGQSIEHVVCIEGKTNIVQDIRPKLDTKDYYGNLPIHYTIANNDY